MMIGTQIAPLCNPSVNWNQGIQKEIKEEMQKIVAKMTNNA